MKMTRLSYGYVARLVLWVYTAPVLTLWALLSFIPIAGIFIEGASTISKAGDVIFLALGFGGLLTGYIVVLFLAAPGFRTKVFGALRGRVGAVSAYASAWLFGYGLFKYLIE
jgi:hypothetical protein